MAKNASGSSSAPGAKTKAGKKSGAYTEPPPVNAEKRDARLAGLSQFVAKQFPAPLPFQKGSWDQAMDSLCRHFNVRRIRKQGQDTGIRWDSNRKHFLMPPNRKVEEG